MCEKVSADGRTHAACKTKYTLDGATFVFRYKPPVSGLVKAFKYRFGREVEGILIEWTAEELRKLYIPPKDNLTLVPIPLHGLRSNWRGFNQSEVLGKKIAGEMGWGFRNDILVRPRFGKPQTEVREASKRKINVQGIFTANQSRVTSHQSLILFDDVWTTGSTMKEAARVLKHAGVKFVWGLAIAR